MLRKVMSRYVPDEITEPGQAGLLGPRRELVPRRQHRLRRRDLLFSPDAAIYEFLDPDGVRPLVNDHLEGRENRRLLLWSLLSFEHWCRTFLKEGSAAGAAAR